MALPGAGRRNRTGNGTNPPAAPAGGDAGGTWRRRSTAAVAVVVVVSAAGAAGRAAAAVVWHARRGACAAAARRPPRATRSRLGESNGKRRKNIPLGRHRAVTWNEFPGKKSPVAPQRGPVLG